MCKKKKEKLPTVYLPTMKNLGWKTSNIWIINAGWNLQILELSLDICLHKKIYVQNLQ